MLAADVAMELTKLGRRFSANAVVKMENGLRRIDVDDLMALAVVLDCGPLALLLPHSAAGTQVAFPYPAGSTRTDDELWLWALGEKPLGRAESDVEFSRRANPVLWKMYGSRIAGMINADLKEKATPKSSDPDA